MIPIVPVGATALFATGREMPKKSERVLRRELRKAEKRCKNSNRIKPKVVASDPKAVPINQIITLDYLTNPQSDK